MKIDLKSFLPGLFIGVSIAFGLNTLNASNNSNMTAEVITVYEEDSPSNKEFKIKQILSKIESKKFLNVDDFMNEEEQKKVFNETLTFRMQNCAAFANYVSERTQSISTYDLNLLRIYDNAYHTVCKRVD